MEVRGKEGQNPEWVRLNFSQMFDEAHLQGLLRSMVRHSEIYFTPSADKTPLSSYEFPDFGANRVRRVAQDHLCEELAYYARRAVAAVTDMPSLLLVERRAAVWKRIRIAFEAHCYSDGNIRRAIQSQTSEQDRGEKESDALGLAITSTEKTTGNEVLIEVGVKSALGMMFSLLRQAWSQLAWQRKLEETLAASNLALTAAFRAPTISLPNEVLRSTLDILKAIPPLSFSNLRSLSRLGTDCLKQCNEFLFWVLSPLSHVDVEGKRLAAEITMSITLQFGTLNTLLEWVDKMLGCLTSYRGRRGEEEEEEEEEVAMPCMSREFCDHVVEELRARTVSGGSPLCVLQVCMAVLPRHVHIMQSLHILVCVYMAE